MYIWIIAFVVGVIVVGLLLAARKTEEKSIAGICSSALDQTVRKNRNKAKIVELLQASEVSNTELRSALGVSRSTVVRYMDELEKEGRVAQVGDSGRGVLYQAI